MVCLRHKRYDQTDHKIRSCQMSIIQIKRCLHRVFPIVLIRAINITIILENMRNRLHITIWLAVRL